MTSNNDCGKTFIDLANIFSFLNIFRWLSKSKAGSSQQHKPSTRRRGGPKRAPASANAGGEQCAPLEFLTKEDRRNRDVAKGETRLANDDPENDGTMQRWV